MAIYTDLLKALKQEPLSCALSTDRTLISASAAPHCGIEKLLILSHGQRLRDETVGVFFCFVLFLFFVFVFHFCSTGPWVCTVAGNFAAIFQQSRTSPAATDLCPDSETNAQGATLVPKTLTRNSGFVSGGLKTSGRLTVNPFDNRDRAGSLSSCGSNHRLLTLLLLE